jgi:dephospho-CoA kinase
MKFASITSGTASFDFIAVRARMTAMIDDLKLVGLTGGIGAGKSTVADLLRARGVPVLDADQLSREVMSPGQPAHREIAAAWPGVLAPDGQIDRRKLGAVVFSDPQARKTLEAITHPRIQALCQARARALAGAGHRLAFYEASLLVETGRQRDFDGLVVVTAAEEQRLARVQARDGSTREGALARLRAQMPEAEKVKAATHVIDNGGDRAATERQVDALIAGLR